jgi:hypothetical protein
VKNSPAALFEVGTINRPLPTPQGGWPLRKLKSILEIQILSSLLSLSKTPILVLVLEKDLSSFEHATFKQENLTHSLNDLVLFVTLGDSFP